MKRLCAFFGLRGTAAHGCDAGQLSSKVSRSLIAAAFLTIGVTSAGCSGSGQHPSALSNTPDAGSTSADAGSDAVDEDAGVDDDAGGPPKVNHSRPQCILSADCPAGLHCDLAECIQDCNTDTACSNGSTCSARARCLGKGQSDIDLKPPSDSAGTLDVSPLSVKLTRANNGRVVNLTLSTKATTEVRYRAQVDAPYLSIDKPRGSFTKGTTLPIKVNTANIVASDIAGSVTLYTTLGTTIVQLPLHAGLTGRYHGSLRYNGGAIPLGDTRFDLDIIEDNGDVSARVVPENSMLFPQGKTANDVAYGFGSLSGDGVVDLTVEHLIDAAAGGKQNLLGRQVGRRIILHLNSPSTGVFNGSFTESIYGLFQSPVTTSGVAHLEYMPDAVDPDFQVKSVPMPSMPSSTDLFPLSMSSVFHPGESSPCAVSYVSAPTVLSSCYDPLRASVQDVNTKFSELSENCKSILGLSSNAKDPGACGCVTYAACAMGMNARGSASQLGAEQGALAQNLVAPAALVAQEELVAALRESVTNGKGMTAELAHYDVALGALVPVAKWMLQPGMLEFFRNIPDSQASVAPDIRDLSNPSAKAKGTETEPYPVARALARVVQMLVDVNAERQRVVSATTSSDLATKVTQAQYNSVMAYLEAVALLGVLDNWSTAPASALGSVAGMLTKLDHAFTDMTQGMGDSLGSPKRHVPFVYRSDDTVSGTTNFEQSLTIAGKAVTQLQPLESAFIEDSKQVDQAQYANASQLTNAKNTFDQQLHDLCGSDFNLDPTSGTIDWTKCGATTGTVAELALGIQQAQTAAQASAQRAKGQQDKITVDVNLVATKKKLRADELSFVSETGQQIVANTFAEGMISAIQEMILVASNSNLWNAGAPALAAVASYGLGLQKAGLEADTESLRQAQTMKAQETDADIEYADGMANIQREQIDLCEIVIEARESVVGILESQLRFANSLSRAQELYANRTQTNQLIASDPSMDPAYRLVRNKTAFGLLNARGTAQKQLLDAGRALEYEMNYDLPTLETAVQSARNYTTLSRLQTCLDGLFDQFNEPYGAPQTYSTTVSIRKLFGISGPRLDEVTGATLSEGEQFRAYVLNNQSLNANGTLRIQFSTNLMPKNGLWTTENCLDKISDVQAQLVGDFLGDNEAEIRLGLSGGAVLRACDTSELRAWNLDTERAAVIQAGVNTFSDVTNTTLFGQSVARATWTLDILGGDLAPANADVDVTKLDDIVLKIKHKALPLQLSSTWSLDDSCLTDIINY